MDICESLGSKVSIYAQRLRKRRAWMMDYEVSDVYQSDDDDDTIAHFALFSYCDPISFQEAVKEPKWQKPMDAEILVIEKNDTWLLTDLPNG